MKYKKNRHLCATPDRRYKNEWTSWHEFLTGTPKKNFAKYSEAQRIVQSMGISSASDYRNRYKENSKLHCRPVGFYREWQGWQMFLFNAKPTEKASFKLAKQIVQELGIINRATYWSRYKEDDRLPSSPNIFYSDKWQGWSHFTRGIKRIIKVTYIEACIITRNFEFKTKQEYQRKYKMDKRLPCNPPQSYPEWKSWPDFLGTK